MLLVVYLFALKCLANFPSFIVGYLYLLLLSPSLDNRQQLFSIILLYTFFNWDKYHLRYTIPIVINTHCSVNYKRFCLDLLVHVSRTITKKYNKNLLINFLKKLAQNSVWNLSTIFWLRKLQNNLKILKLVILFLFELFMIHSEIGHYFRINRVIFIVSHKSINRCK